MYNYCNYVETVDFDQTIHHWASAIPQKVDEVHFCSSNGPKLRSFATGLQLFIDPRSRFRLGSHIRTPDEAEFGLQPYGIPTDDCPMRKHAKWSIDWHQEWLTIQQAREERPVPSKSMATKSSTDGYGIIDVPLKFDVLHGKGRK